MISKVKTVWLKTAVLAVLLLANLTLRAADSDYPARPEPAMLVNDFAGMLSTQEEAQLERKLEDYARNSSTQITIVTLKSLGSYDVADYTFELGNRWGIGQKDKDNGVLILTSLEDRKGWIAVGYGLEGKLTDATTGQIYRNEIVSHFKQGDYYGGFDSAADAIIAATKGEYTNDKKDVDASKGKFPTGLLIIIVIIIFVIISRKGGGGGGGGYMSRRGSRGFGSGFLLGSILSNLGRGGNDSGWGGGSSGGWGGGSSGGGGGFGGFGGGGFGGGGAGGSW
ncbi:MAG: TPM domain-containing protein [Sphingobacteriales bacterium]|nr:MAG: TPM domain-containing protein [Sphingobacteriales bacterium]